MVALNCSYLNGGYGATLDAGGPNDSLRDIVKRAKLDGEQFGYGILRVDDNVQGKADLDKPIGNAERIEFDEVERAHPIDLDAI